MSADKENISVEIDSSKAAYRRHVWQLLEHKHLANFPRPIYGRIPNFKGSDEAAAKLAQLEEFKHAKYIEVNPDKAQENARVVVLENHKQLYVPVPRLKKGLLKLINVDENASKGDIRAAISRRGIEHDGKTISLGDPVEIDMFIMGSVAVSVDGHRIGKGKGYADLEFAMLLEMKAITEKTVVVTIVHDLQVFDSLPKDMFKPYDVPVDYILTPSKIIKVQKRLPRPEGIIWSILSNRRVNLMPVLQELRTADETKGRDVTLKAEDTDVESYEPKRYLAYRRFQRRRPRSEGRTSDSQAEDKDEKDDKERAPRQRFSKRRPRFNSRKNDKESGAETNDADKEAKTNRARRQFRRNKSQIDFSLMVSNIEKNVRVRDLKNALTERGIKPNEITWRGYKGFCYLHYAKPRVTTENDDPAVSPVVVDSVIEILQNLRIMPESDNSLSVKVMEPISRIETTDVTAV
ncbi:methenyltetrahydrofolate synthase domain-containing protein [Atheta coriaria]|uniref:methenyltetrahydrofolate synthase domain-containing protein n=1 Tax=Dalotia coriaria TaxID=877792 RepID=UPI0031F45CF6